LKGAQKSATLNRRRRCPVIGTPPITPPAGDKFPGKTRPTTTATTTTKSEISTLLMTSCYWRKTASQQLYICLKEVASTMGLNINFQKTKTYFINCDTETLTVGQQQIEPVTDFFSVFLWFPWTPTTLRSRTLCQPAHDKTRRGQPHTNYMQKITGHQLSELIELAQNREDWHQLVVESADSQPPD